MKDDNGGSAFPHSFTQDSIGDCSGMTLRDYFAAKAMQGFSATIGGVIDINYGLLATDAYRLADAMLEARENECNRLHRMWGANNSSNSYMHDMPKYEGFM